MCTPSALRLGFLAKKNLIFFTFLATILILLGFLGNNKCQDFGKKWKNRRSWQKFQDYPRLYKILARKLRRQAVELGRHIIDKKHFSKYNKHSACLYCELCHCCIKRVFKFLRYAQKVKNSELFQCLHCSFALVTSLITSLKHWTSSFIVRSHDHMWLWVVQYKLSLNYVNWNCAKNYLNVCHIWNTFTFNPNFTFNDLLLLKLWV